MEKVFNVKKEIESVSGVAPFISEIFFGDTDEGLTLVCKNFTRGKIEVVMTEKDLARIGFNIVEKIKSLGVEVQLLLIEESDSYFTTVKSSLDRHVGACIAVGDKHLLSAVRYYASLYGVSCYAIVTTPDVNRILCDSVWLKTKIFSTEVKADKFKKIIIDQNLIEKAPRECFAESFAFSTGKLTALIDYKINCFVSGENVDEWVFSTSKKAINWALSTPSYDNYTAPILASQILIAVVNAQSTALMDTGTDCIKNALSVFAENLSSYKKEMLAFEKTVRIYHMFFSNDFSNLLSVPDYYADIELLERESKRDRGIFTKNLKIPSEKRRNLINLLLSQTADGFKAETTAILKAFSKIKKIYDAICGDAVKKESVSYKQIKNSVITCTYFTSKTSVLTLCRDMGILKCAN